MAEIDAARIAHLHAIARATLDRGAEALSDMIRPAGKILLLVVLFIVVATWLPAVSVWP